jgi:hypothetical protein
MYLNVSIAGGFFNATRNRAQYQSDLAWLPPYGRKSKNVMA